MKKLITLILAMLALTPIYVSAQDMSWMEKAPDKYIAANTQTIISRESACNQGEESFMDFIPKWRTDASFRNKRVHFDDDMSKVSFEYFDNFKLFKASAPKKVGCCTSYTTWFGVTADQVCMKFTEDCTCGEYGGSAVMARFRRIDGKWFLTDMMMAG